MEWITFATASVKLTVAFMFFGARLFTKHSAFISFTVAYALFAVSFFFFSVKQHGDGFVYIGNVTIIVGTLAVAVGLSQRAPWRVAWRPVLALALWGLLGNAASAILGDPYLRLVALYTSLGFIYLLIAHAGHRARARFVVERMLVISLYVIAFMLLSNPRLLVGIMPELVSMELVYLTWPAYAVVWIVLSQLVAGTTIALSMRDVIVQARKEAETDVLTGIANRRAFDRHIARSGRRGDRPALVMLDIDHFKRINDQFGHDEGDRCIAMVGAIVGKYAPEGCCAARLGGEEFAILLNDGGADAASTVARAIHHALRQSARVLDFTVSIGVAEGPKEALYKRADKALYAAKSEGRNRTCVWAPDREQAVLALPTGELVYRNG
ncbi:MAG: GGDEF domain-containing protein [Pseudomonadota bacterium]